MEHIALIGELISISMADIINIMSKHLDENLIRLIEQGSVLDYEDSNIELNIEPLYEGDITQNDKVNFLITANFFLAQKDFDDYVSKLKTSLLNNNVYFSFDFQKELEDGTAIGEEFNISNLPPRY